MKPKSYNILKEFKTYTNTYVTQLSQSIKNIKDTYEDDIILVKEELLTKIAGDYSLDLSELKRRYLRRKKKISTSNDNDNGQNPYYSDSEYIPSQLLNSQNNIEQMVLYKISHNDNDYYIEPIDGGKVYDINKNEVGIWKDGFIELNMDLIEQLKILEIQITDNNDYIINTDTLKINSEDDDFCKVIKKQNDSITLFVDSFVDSTKKKVDNNLITKRKKKTKPSIEI